MIMRHGYSAYVNHRCRCDTCRAAAAAYNKDRRAKRTAITRDSGLPEGVKHGLSAYKNWGCRCQACTRENGLDGRARRSAARGAD